MPAPLVCDVTAIPTEAREAHQRVMRHLISAATDLREFTEGFAFQFPADEFDVPFPLL